MTGALILLAITAVFGLVLWILDCRKRREMSTTATTASAPADSEPEEKSSGECCGLHIVCEKESLVPFTTEIEYYDDEELDRFKGRTASDYSAEEIDEFRDVMLTMHPDEIAGWARSLQLREVTLPETIREELLLIVREARQ